MLIWQKHKKNKIAHRQLIAGREILKIYKNCALCDKFLQFGMVLGVGIRFSKTTAYKLG
jgi:hypothetical protein